MIWRKSMVLLIKIQHNNYISIFRLINKAILNCPAFFKVLRSSTKLWFEPKKAPSLSAIHCPWYSQWWVLSHSRFLITPSLEVALVEGLRFFLTIGFGISLYIVVSLLDKFHLLYWFPSILRTSWLYLMMKLVRTPKIWVQCPQRCFATAGDSQPAQ